MEITVGSITITVTDAHAYRYQNGKLVLKMTVPQEGIAHDDLKTLLKNNNDDIVKTDGEKTETFSGFYHTLTILDRDDVYECEVECISETERKVQGLIHTVSDQTQLIVAQQNEIETLGAANQELTDALLEMSELVYSAPEEVSQEEAVEPQEVE